MKLKLTNEQKLILSQKMQQSLKLLQMNSHELETYLNELSMENPLIEVVPPREMPPSHEKQFSARTTTDPDIMSRTIADIEEQEQVQSAHVAEAFGLRFGGGLKW